MAVKVLLDNDRKLKAQKGRQDRFGDAVKFHMLLVGEEIQEELIEIEGKKGQDNHTKYQHEEGDGHVIKARDEGVNFVFHKVNSTMACKSCLC